MGDNSLLIYADDVNLQVANIDTINKNTKVLLKKKRCEI
jgi:hypothetical protein